MMSEQFRKISALKLSDSGSATHVLQMNTARLRNTCRESCIHTYDVEKEGEVMHEDHVKKAQVEEVKQIFQHIIECFKDFLQILIQTKNVCR